MQAVFIALAFLASTILSPISLANENQDSIEVLEEVIVVGTRGSLQSAVEKQEAADSFISVADSDAIGNFPDTTAAEAVRRLSGVSIENDQGEGRYVTIRGMSSDLNSVAVNGASLMAPENGRSVLLDGVPTELLDSITVSKSLTPDQDADSIGGRIDFRTKNPTDLKERLLRVKMDTTYNEQTKSAWTPRVSMTYGDFINRNMAHVLGITYSEKKIKTFNNETGFGWDQNDYMNDDYEMRYYDIKRQRIGVTYDLDTLVGDNSRLFLNAFWNEYTDDELRLKDEYGKLDSDQTPTATSMFSERIRHDGETRVREEVRTIMAFNIGAETLMGSWATDMKASFSYAEEDDSNNADITFRRDDKDFGGTIDWSNPRHPTIAALDPDLRNPAAMEFKELEIENSVSKDQELAFEFNTEREFDFATLKFGAKYRSREKDRDNNKDFYEDPSERMLSDFNPQQLDWNRGDQIFSPNADPEAVWALASQLSSLTLDDSETYAEDFIVDEDILSVYAMSTIDLGTARIVAGVRFEDTSVDSQAFDQDGNPTFAKKDYSFWAPSFNVKWNITDVIVMRAAATRSLSRPGFVAMSPVLELEIDGEDRSGKYGNPDLEPLKSTNLDFSIEYYGEGMNWASIGIFHKDIKNAIYKTIQEEATINGVVFNDGVATWINADDSKITGIEANIQWGLENGIFIAANFTHNLQAESTFNYEDATSFTTPFRKMAENAANVSFGYNKDKWDVRIAMNYRSEYLDWLADEEDDIDKVSTDNSRFADKHMQWDITAKYLLSDKLTIKAEAINIGDRPEYYYWGRKNRISQWDVYGASYSLGITYQL